MNPAMAASFGCWAIASIAALAGYLRLGPWEGVLAALFSSLPWILVRKTRPSLCLVLCLACDAIGIVFGAEANFLILAAGASLAAWDLGAIEWPGPGQASEGGARRRLFLRLRSLGAAMGGSFAVIFIGRSAKVEIPFLLMAVISVAAALGFDSLLRFLRRGR